MTSMTQKSVYNWRNIIFFGITPLIAIAGVAWRLAGPGVPWETWSLAFVMLYAGGLSITAGYHRLFSHRTYEANKLVRIAYILFGAATFQSSVRWWAAEHRIHHQKVDTNEDPYSITKGFWHAHIGWLLTEDPEPPTYDMVKDLDKDPWIRFQHRYYILVASFMAFILPALVAALWGDFFGGFFVAGVAVMVINHHFTFSINSFCHFIGSQPFTDENTARDSWFTALFTYGEGYHNFHHYFQTDYRNGIKPWHWDPTKWLIRGLSFVGLTRKMRRTPESAILVARAKMEKKRLAERLATLSPDLRTKASEALACGFEQLHKAHERLMLINESYRQARRQRMSALKTQFKNWQHELELAKQEFDAALEHWRALATLQPVPA